MAASASPPPAAAPGVPQYCAAKVCLLALANASRASTREAVERERALKVRVRDAMLADGVRCVDTRVHTREDTRADEADAGSLRYVVLKPAGALPLDEQSVLAAWRELARDAPARAPTRASSADTVPRVLARGMAARLRERERAHRAQTGRTSLTATCHKPRDPGDGSTEGGQRHHGGAQAKAPSPQLLRVAREYTAASEALRAARKPWRQKQAPHREICRDAEPHVIDSLARAGGGEREVQVRRRREAASEASAASAPACAQGAGADASGTEVGTAELAPRPGGQGGRGEEETVGVEASVRAGLVDAMSRAGDGVLDGAAAPKVETYSMRCETKTTRPRVGPRAVVQAVEDAVSEFYKDADDAGRAYTDAFTWTPTLVAHVEAGLRDWYRDATRETERPQLQFRPTRR